MELLEVYALAVRRGTCPVLRDRRLGAARPEASAARRLAAGCPDWDKENRLPQVTRARALAEGDSEKAERSGFAKATFCNFWPLGNLEPKPFRRKGLTQSGWLPSFPVITRCGVSRPGQIRDKYWAGDPPLAAGSC